MGDHATGGWGPFYRALAIKPAVRHRVSAELGRVEMFPLHGADGARHIAIAGLRDALQRGGKIEQECVTACHSQRASRLEDSGELGVGKRDRRHAAQCD
jgi:hypothetical protein